MKNLTNRSELIEAGIVIDEKKWFSICSKHQKPQSECSLCQIGHYQHTEEGKKEMATDLEKEALDVVDIINAELYEVLEKQFGEKKAVDLQSSFYLSFTSIGWGCYLEFQDNVIWSSEEDERDYIDEEEDIHEPLLVFVKRTLNEHFKVCGKIQLC